MTLADILAQASGLVAFGIFLIAYQVKDTRKTQLLFAPGNVLYGVQYALLGSLSASFCMFSASLRDIAGACFSDRILKIVSVAHLTFITSVTFLYGHSWHEWLVVLSGFLSTIAAVVRDDFYQFRFLLLGRQAAMIVFNIWVQSIAGIVHIGFVMLSNAWGIYMHRKNAIPS